MFELLAVIAKDRISQLLAKILDIDTESDRYLNSLDRNYFLKLSALVIIAFIFAIYDFKISILLFSVIYMMIKREREIYLRRIDVSLSEMHIGVLIGYLEGKNLDKAVVDAYENSGLSGKIKFDLHHNMFEDIREIMQKAEIYSSRMIINELGITVKKQMEKYRTSIVRRSEKINESLVAVSVLYMLSMMMFIIIPVLSNMKGVM